mgnify:CR=1 FL=1
MSMATKVGKSAFAAEFRRLVKTESTNQRKVSLELDALRRQLGGFLLLPSKCKRFTDYHILSLAVGLFQQAFANSRRQFEGV